MTYLIVSQYFWPENFIINDLTDCLVKKGHRIVVLTGQPNYPEGVIFPGYKWWKISKETRDNGVVLIRIPQWPRGKKSAIGLALNYFSYIFFASVFGPFLLFGEKINSIFVFAVSPITQAIPAIFIGWIKKARVAIWVQDLWPASLSATGYVKNPFVLSLVHKLVKWIYNHVDLLLGQSQGFVKALSAENCSSQVDYFPNSIKKTEQNNLVQIQDNQRLSELLLLMKDCFSVVFAGNIGEAQSVGTIVEAAKILRGQKIGIFVVGSGSKLDFLQKSKEQNSLECLILPGRFTQHEIQMVYQAADALLLTLSDSQTFNLTIPLRTQSYLAAGKPIVAAVNGESQRVIMDAGAGFCGPSENHEELAQNILKIFRLSAIERRNMGARGQLYFADHFDMDRQVDRLVSFLR